MLWSQKDLGAREAFGLRMTRRYLQAFDVSSAASATPSKMAARNFIAALWEDGFLFRGDHLQSMAFLVNPADRALAQSQVREMLSAARDRKLELHVLNARSESDFDAVFAEIKRLRVGGLVIGAGSIFISGRKKLADLTIRHAVPATSQYRDFAAAGGLMSYGSDILDSYRLAGVYTGRVLKGENPAELPVVQATKFELIINLKTAKALGISVPPSMQARADEMIE